MKTRVCLLFLTIIALLTSALPLPAQAATAVTLLDVADLKAKFPHKKYWNHGTGPNNPDGWTNSPCTHHYTTCFVGPLSERGHCGCNSIEGGSMQCHGFIVKLTLDAYGESLNYWEQKQDLNGLKPGDAVRWMNNRHTIWIYEIKGNTVTYAECNVDNRTCQIKWDTKSNLSKIAQSLTTHYVAPYSIDERPEPVPRDPVVIEDSNLFMLETMRAADLRAKFANYSVKLIRQSDQTELSPENAVGSNTMMELYSGTALAAQYELTLLGDIDGNGVVTASDARLALRNSVKLETFAPWQTKAADITRSGEVTAASARQILRISARLEQLTI